MLLLQREQDTIPSPAVSQSVIWESGGLWETARLQFPMQAAGVVEAKLTLLGQRSCVFVG